MEKDEKFALFLGMLCGDGCLSISHNGEGYRDYPIQFYNTNKQIVIQFQNLLSELFTISSKILVSKRENKQDLWYISKCSKESYLKIKETGFPEGVKRDVLRIPQLIKEGTNEEKLSFVYDFLITDGCLRETKDILFHSGSKTFLEELSDLICEFTKLKKPVREYIQREKFKSYQLNLNKKETEILLSNMPTWDNGTPFALRSSN